MQIDDITKAAQERLAALDAEAKPHEDALTTINAERDRLRAILAASKGVPPLPVYPNTFPLTPPEPFPGYPGGPQWVPPISPNASFDDGHFTISSRTAGFTTSACDGLTFG